MTGEQASLSVIFIIAGVFMLALGVLIVFFRKQIARTNGDLLRALGGKAGRETAKRSTPLQFAMAGSVGIVGGALMIVSVVIRLADGG